MKKVSSVILFLLSACVVYSQGTTLVYCFQNNFNEQSGSGPTLIQAPAGGYFTSDVVCGSTITYYHFNFNGGFYFNNASAGNFVNASDGHTIELYMRFDNTNSWRKIIDYKNLGSDCGVYNYWGYYQFYCSGTSSIAVFNPGVWVYAAIVREPGANANYHLYYGGSTSSLYTFLDNSQMGLPNASNLIYFFVDDHVTGQWEASSGDISVLKISNYPLTGTDIFNNAQSPCMCGIPLPLDWVAFSGSRINRLNHVNLKWVMNRPTHPGHFIILRSTDGNTFEEIANIPILQPADPFHEWIDRSAPSSKLYYKVKYRDKDGNQILTKTIEIPEFISETAFIVYPNFLSKKESSTQVYFYSTNPETSFATWSIIDMSGKVIKSGTLSNQNSVDIKLDE
ncbi:MAG: T9SS type A sorting domain-containing protein, partial [Bacteroidia bacterium]|nr:T9SS type A sorting domain-containing protein [Bacteroidia bacterium]